MKMKKIFLLLLLSVFFLNSCYYDNFSEINPVITVCDTTGLITFNGEISAIFNRSCGAADIGCHKTGNTQDVNLDDYTSTFDLAVNDKLLGSILHLPGYSPMPPGGGSMDKCEIQKIQAWVNRGEPEN